MKKLTFSLLMAASLLGVIGDTKAKDTDLYLTTPLVTRDSSPKVLLIIDNSGSMKTDSVESREPYDPTIDYIYEASIDANVPDFQAGRIYWSTSGSPPASDSKAYFAATKNKCVASTSLLNTYGYASGARVAGYENGNGWDNLRTKWNKTTDQLVTYVDCETDDGATDPLGYATNKPGPYTSDPTKEVLWSNYSTPTLYTSNYMAYWYNPNFVVYKMRIDITKETLKSIIDTNLGLKFGLMTFNDNNSSDSNGGRLVMKIDTMDTVDADGNTRREEMKNTIDSIIAKSNTPLAETLWEAHSYLSGKAVDYGKNVVTTGKMTLTAVAAASGGTTSKFTRTTGSFVTDGFKVGQTVYSSGFTNTANNRTAVVSAVSATELTVKTTAVLAETGNGNEAIATESPGRDTTAEDAGSPKKYISPFSFDCEQIYIIYMTDGAPTSDTAADTKIDALDGIGATTGSRLDELAHWMYTHDATSGDLLTEGTGGRRVLLYTIGFGDGISADAAALLQSSATKAGGKYYTASNADTLASAFQAAIGEAFSKTTSFAAPSLSVNAFNKLFNRDEVYFALFKPEAEQRWAGNIKKFMLCNDNEAPYSCTFGEVMDARSPQPGQPAIDPAIGRIKDDAVSYWGDTTTADGSSVTAGGAGAKVPAPASRIMYTYTGTYPINTPVDLSASAHKLEVANTLITDTMLGLPSGAVNRDDLVNWIRGMDIHDADDDGDSTDQRWGFADPVHSRPVAITFGGTTAAPIIKLFVGTNDGALHMINENTGIEEWAFIPKELLGIQSALSDNANGDHLWGMDGTPSFWIIDNNNNGIIEPENATGKNDKAYMFIGMRRGGRNIYAFDVTPPSTLTNPAVSAGIVPKLMWVIRGGVDAGFERLGETWSRPLVARIRTTTGNADDSEYKTVLIFAGGYDNRQDVPGAPGDPWRGADTMGNAIYIVDPLTGQRLWWAGNTGSGATLEVAGMAFSIPSDLALMDPDGDGAIDRIYVGDVAGQIFRIDLSPTLKANTSVGYRFADIACPAGTRPDCGGTTAQDRRKFFYPPDVTQVNDSMYEDAGQAKYDLVTIASGDREDPLDLMTVGAETPVQAVHNRIYAFRDYKIDNQAGATTLPAALTEANLYDASNNYLQVPDTTTGSAYDLALNGGTAADGSTVNGIKDLSGWYISLWSPDSALSDAPWLGEKGLAKTVIFDGNLYVTTFLPTNAETIDSPCSPSEGQAFVYSLNLLNGTAIMDNNGDNQITTADRKKHVGGGIPSELVTVIREGGTTALVGTSGGAASPKIDSDLPRFKTYWYEEVE